MGLARNEACSDETDPFEPQSLSGDTGGFDEAEQREWGSLLQLRKHHMRRVGSQQPELRTRAGQFVDLVSRYSVSADSAFAAISPSIFCMSMLLMSTAG